MSDYSNGLTPAQAERLALLAEEAGEVIQAIGKILRHGYRPLHPSDPSMKTNRARLEIEIGDFEAAKTLMIEALDIEQVPIETAEKRKLATVGR